MADRLTVNTDPEDIDIYEQDPDAALKTKKKAAAFFIMGISRLKNAGQWADDIELFTVTELTNLDNKDTNGFVKVVATTAHLLTKLPEHVWMPEVESPPPSSHDEANRDLRDLADDGSMGTLKPANAQEMDRNNVIRELIETERKYIQDLEHMHVSLCVLALAPVANLRIRIMRRPSWLKMLSTKTLFIISSLVSTNCSTSSASSPSNWSNNMSCPGSSSDGDVVSLLM
jgi:cell division control protein 24